MRKKIKLKSQNNYPLTLQLKISQQSNCVITATSVSSQSADTNFNNSVSDYKYRNLQKHLYNNK